MLSFLQPDRPYFMAPTLQILLAALFIQSWKDNIKLWYHWVGTAKMLVIEQFWWDLMEKDENQHFNQWSHDITHKIKKKFITNRPTLIFLAMLVETQH